MTRTTTILLGLTVASFTLIGCVPENTGTQREEKTSTAAAEKSEETGKTEKKPVDEVQFFKDCTGKSGSPTEKTAVKHVTKIDGVDEDNLIPTADIYTDFTGGFASRDQGNAQLIVAAFKSCYTSKTEGGGLVTVYGSDGETIANGNY